MRRNYQETSVEFYSNSPRTIISMISSSLIYTYTYILVFFFKVASMNSLSISIRNEAIERLGDIIRFLSL